MSERSIIFSAPMVRAILAGQKTQTRRVARPTAAGHVKEPRGHRRWHPSDPNAALACPYGQPGDRLWVRETWAAWHGPDGKPEKVLGYRADTPAEGFGHDDPWWEHCTWRPSIFMPRWASRITLEVESVRVERLQAITEDDAQAEGVERPILEEGAIMHTLDDGTVLRGHPLTGEYRDAFRDLWDGLNAARGHGWDTNPWVWVVTFTAAA